MFEFAIAFICPVESWIVRICNVSLFSIFVICPWIFIFSFNVLFGVWLIVISSGSRMFARNKRSKIPRREIPSESLRIMSCCIIRKV